jgi:starch-binding outer membrane protein, SusD/RagB family
LFKSKISEIMKKYYTYFIGLVLGLLLTGCEDFLDRTPSNEISSATFFTQKKDLIYAVNATYKAVSIGGWGVGTTWLCLENITDNAVDNHSWNSDFSIATGTTTSQDGFVSGAWSACYTGIQRANRAIDGAEGIKDIDSDLKARLVGEAKFLRAYNYLELVYLWGDVPFFTSQIKPAEAIGVAREDKDVILDAMVQDLTTIAGALPLSYSGSDVGRVTRGAALALKARILLYQGKWTEAAAAAKTVMDLKVYSLYPNYKGLFDYEGRNCSEVIFDFQAMSNAGRSAGLGEPMLWFFSAASTGGWSNSTPTQSVVDDYECTDGKTTDVSPLFDPANPYNNRDPRLTQSILYPGHDWMGGVYNSIPGATYPGKTIIIGDNLNDGVGSLWNKTFTGYNWLKYISEKDRVVSNVTDGGLHFIFIRYADVLLMYAEAKIEANVIDQSVYDAINEVRARPTVNMPAIASGKTQSEMRTIVRRERRVELAFEGLRLFDIRRWHIAHLVMPGKPKSITYIDPVTHLETTVGASLPSRIFDENKHYLWPIPQSEIDVSKIEQNTGW